MNSLSVSAVPRRAIRRRLDLDLPTFHISAPRTANWLWLAVFLSLLALAGCAPPASTIRVEIKPDYAKFPRAEPVPMTVGVYQSWDFLTFRFQRYLQNSPVVAPIGSASAQMFDRLLSTGFAKTVPLHVLPSGGKAVEGVDAIIETRVEAFDFLVSAFNEPSEDERIVYRLILYTPRGAPVHTWTVEGAYRPPDGKRVRHVSEDMEIAGARFLTGLRAEIDKARPLLAAEASVNNIAETDGSEFKAEVNVHPAAFSTEESQILSAGRYLPVTVSVRNPHPVPVAFRTDQMTLLLPDGQRLAPISQDMLLAGLETERMGGFIGYMAFGPVGMLAGMAAQEEQAGVERAERRKAFLNATVAVQTLQPGQATKLQAYFRLPEGHRPSAALLAGWYTEHGGRNVHPWKTALESIPPPMPPPRAQADSNPGSGGTGAPPPEVKATPAPPDSVPVPRLSQPRRSLVLFPIHSGGCIYTDSPDFCGAAVKPKDVAAWIGRALFADSRFGLDYTAYPTGPDKSLLQDEEIKSMSWTGIIDIEPDLDLIRRKTDELGADVALAIAYDYDDSRLAVRLYVVSATGPVVSDRRTEIHRGVTESDELARLVRTAMEEYLVCN